MKDNIHPKYFPTAKVTCACGNSFTTGSTQAELHTEICSQCHPFYTGKQKLMDTAGTVDKFRKRSATAVEIKSKTAVKKPRKARTSK